MIKTKKTTLKQKDFLYVPLSLFQMLLHELLTSTSVYLVQNEEYPENWRVSDYLSPSWILKHSCLSLSCWACFPLIHRWRSWHLCHSNCLHTPLNAARKESDVNLHFLVIQYYVKNLKCACIQIWRLTKWIKKTSFFDNEWFKPMIKWTITQKKSSWLFWVFLKV